MARRPISARNSAWARAIAAFLAARGVTPNQISWASVICAAIAGASFWQAGHGPPASRMGSLLLAAMAIQARLLCNLFDGMVAVEGGRQTKSGEVFNDLPDRISDPLILVPAGYALPFWWGSDLGWAAAAGALFTAYVRMLGGATGASQYFFGPMAKQHRMAVMTAAALLSIAELWLHSFGYTLAAALALIVAGCAVTAWRRTKRIVDELEAKA